MHAFHYINKKLIDIDNTKFDNIHKTNFYIFNQKEYSIQNKFLFLSEMFYNIFNTEEIREEILDNFYKIQKVYHGFARLAHSYKYKKAAIIIETDLIMNPIKENSRCIFCLYQNNYKYLFNIHELIKIVNNSIANSSYFFSNPIPIKNPYNNIIFNKSTLYNIYFFIKMNTLLNIEIFYYYFKTNFNLNKFVKEYQHLLRDFSIKTYLNNSSKEILYDDIISMIDEYNFIIVKYEKQIIIHHEFPIDKLVEIMKPYLKLYLLSHYSLIYVIREKSKKELTKQLSSFKKFNPLFGRRSVKIKKNSFEVSFNMDHVQFNKNEIIKDTSEFMINHTSKVIGEEDDEINNYSHIALVNNDDNNNSNDDNDDNNNSNDDNNNSNDDNDDNNNNDFFIL
jgi:hypothetical protein